MLPAFKVTLPFASGVTSEAAAVPLCVFRPQAACFNCFTVTASLSLTPLATLIIRRFTELLLPTDKTPLPGSLISSPVKAAVVFAFVSLYSTAEFKPSAMEYLDPTTLEPLPIAIAPSELASLSSAVVVRCTFASLPMAMALLFSVNDVLPIAMASVDPVTVVVVLDTPATVSVIVLLYPVFAARPNATELVPEALAMVPMAIALSPAACTFIADPPLEPMAIALSPVVCTSVPIPTER